MKKILFVVLFFVWVQTAYSQNTCGNPPTNIRIDQVNNASCGLNNGYVSLAAGISGVGYYSLVSTVDSRPDQQSGSFANLAPGIYTARCRQESGGCYSNYSEIQFTVNSSSVPVISTSGSTNICNGTPVNLTASGTGAIQWYRNGGAIAGANSSTYSATLAGDYTVTNNCGVSLPSKVLAINSVTPPTNFYADLPCADSDFEIARSTDLLWTPRTIAADNQWYGITYGNGIFVAVSGPVTGSRIMTSTDGVNWTINTNAPDNMRYGITFGNGLFVAVSVTGTGHRVITSPDGITWDSQITPVQADLGWDAVAYGNGIFVAVSYDSANNKVLRSSDGVTWTLSPSNVNNSWLSVTYGNGLFVAVSSNGAGNRVMTSPDGITWTPQQSAANNAWHSVTYGSGFFVAVSETGSGNRVMTSPDGIHWTAQQSAADNVWYSVTYGNGLFVAVSSSGAGNRVMTSTDGVHWFGGTSAADNAWHSVTYGNGMFAAVSYDGTHSRVMTSGVLGETGVPYKIKLKSNIPVCKRSNLKVNVRVTNGSEVKFISNVTLDANTNSGTVMIPVADLTAQTVVSVCGKAGPCDSDPVCPGSIGNITVSSVPPAGAISEYRMAGMSNWQTSPVFSQVPAGATNVYVRSNLNGCYSAEIGLVVNVISTSFKKPQAPVITNNGNILRKCPGQSVTLTCNAGSGDIINWYRSGVLVKQNSLTFSTDLIGNYTCLLTNVCGVSDFSNNMEIADQSQLPPAAVNDHLGEICGNEFTFNETTLLNNDTGSGCGESLIIESIAQPAHGTLIKNNNGTYTYTANAGFGGDDSFTYTLNYGGQSSTGQNIPSAPHYYEYIVSPGISWNAARDAAASKYHDGEQGYLATITSQEENNLITAKLPILQPWLPLAWIGASDSPQEGVWKWVTGPESETQFSIGSTSFNGRYTNWHYDEPNNESGGEHVGQIYSDGKWNDLGQNRPEIKGYVVEYGGLQSVSTTTAKKFSGNGHYYEFIPAPSTLTWQSAKALAAAKTFNNKQGYLVTITSKEENDFVATLLTSQAFMGAADANEGTDPSQEGVWKWVTGPEKGTSQFSGNYGSPAIPGKYTNWGLVPVYEQPDNSLGADHFGMLWSNDSKNIWGFAPGQWNDLPPSHSVVGGYVVEYGGLQSDPPEISLTATVSINVKPQAVVPTVTLGSGTATLCLSGSITLTASAANSYVWSSGETTKSITVYQPGNYTVTVFNEQGCSATSATTAIQSSADHLFAPIITVTRNLCGGDILFTTTPGKVKWYLNNDYYKTTSNGKLITDIEGNYTARAFNDCMESANSNIIYVKINNALKVKTSRFDEVSRNVPSMEELVNLEVDTKASIASEIAESCEAQADGWILKLTPSETSNLNDSERAAYMAKLALLRPKLIAICTAGGDMTHVMGASTLPAGKDVNGMTSFGDAIKSVFGNYVASANPWLLESPFPYAMQPHLFSKTLVNTNEEICTKLNQLRNGLSIPQFYANLKARYKDAMDLSIEDLEMLDKSCTNCRYLLKNEVSYPVFLSSENPGCVTHAEYNSARSALLQEVSGLTDTHENYYTILTNFLNHRWGFTFSSDIYIKFENQPLNSEEVLCSKPLYESIALDPYQEFETEIATAVANGQADYAAYIPKERDKFMLNYITKCAEAKTNVNLEALQNIYHYTLYYYDQADNLVRTVPPEGVNLLKPEQLPWVENARNHIAPACPANDDFPKQNSVKVPALTELGNSLSLSTNAVEMWLYSPNSVSSQLLATTTDALTHESNYLLQTCMDGKFLNVDIFAVNHEDGAGTVTFSNLSHAAINTSNITIYPWTHLVLQSIDFATGKMAVYLNGKLAVADENAPPALCGWEVSGTNTSLKMPEKLTSLKYLRLYNQALSNEEIAANASESCFMLASDHTLQQSLVGKLNKKWYRFNMPSPGDEILANDSITVETKFSAIYPAHGLTTSYAYNSTNQVTQQHTPDGGTSKFWYDPLSRLVVSQNAKQAIKLDENKEPDPAFSYTKYDNLGRIVEVGEKTKARDVGSATIAANLNDPKYLSSAFVKGLIDDANNGTNSQLTQTVYDEAPKSADNALPAGTIQNNLRKRVSASIFRPTPGSTEYSASYYDYDLSGNVKTLWQQVSGLGLKRMDYDYDLVSGKVNKVFYQKGQPDRFYYQYDYDAENRLTQVLNGTDETNAHLVAFYQYYLHGPLARMELGHQLNKVQGLDYAYTLQGWLKGVNGNALGMENDMGTDGAFADSKTKDAMAFSLGYYKGDYTPIGTTANAFKMNYQPPQTTSQPNAFIGLDLFNGNISNTTVAISKIGDSKPVGYSYRYDQLNRLKEMRQHTLTSATTTWDAATANSNDAYKESISYDANGNIQSFLRNGKTGAEAMDKLIYGYNIDPYTGKLADNKLRHVKDEIVSADTEDLENQDDDNYTYDEIGNLIADKDGKLKTISWTVYGKIEKITKLDLSTIAYAYDAAGNRISKTVTPPSGIGGVSTFYIRDAQGNNMGLYEQTANNPVFWKEQTLYGSSRLGMFKPNTDASTNASNPNLASKLWSDYVGYKNYELSNHLGNVMAVITDKRTLNGSGVYEADVVSATDYYSFGSPMPSRTWSLGDSYRYGFNGKENDNEVKGEGNQQDYGMRIYDPRLGRFLSVDPLTESYPELTPYQFASNAPVNSVDLDGLERQIAIDGSVHDGPYNIQKINMEIWNKRMDQVTGAMKKTAAPPKRSNGSVDYASIASRTGIEENALRAIAKVESSGKAFYSDGEPVKRFEGHWFKKSLNKSGIDASQYPDLAYNYGERLSKKHDVGAYNDAVAVDKHSAMLSTSYGAFQIMGFNYEAAGFNTVEEFVASQNTFEGQVESFINFVSSNKSMLRAIKKKDFTTFAKLYNGESYKDNKYDKSMQDKYDELAGKED